MAESVNAVVASAGDFYRFRQLGTIVYEGKVRRVDSELVDTCFVDERGDLIIARAGQMESEAMAREFASVLEKTQCETAYALDGGQTAVIVMEGKPMNRVVFGQQRRISDILYFATALPEGGEVWIK